MVIDDTKNKYKIKRIIKVLKIIFLALKKKKRSELVSGIKGRFFYNKKRKRKKDKLSHEVINNNCTIHGALQK